MVQPGYDLSEYGGCGDTNDMMCANVAKMFNMVYQAGVKYFIQPFPSRSPTCQAMAAALPPNPNVPPVEAAMDTYYRLLLLKEGMGTPHPVVMISGDLVGGSITILDGFAGSTGDPTLAHASARRVRAAR
jgi:hypothetical protein